MPCLPTKVLTGLALVASLAPFTLRSPQETQAPASISLPQSDSQAIAVSTRSLLPLASKAVTRDFASLADSLHRDDPKKGSQAFETLSSLYREWGSVDSEAALAHLQTTSLGIQHFSKDVLRGWAQSGDIEGASHWVDRNIAQALSGPFYEAIIDGLGDSNNHEAALQLAQGSAEQFQGSLASHAIERWSDEDLPAASRWIEQNQSRLSNSVLDSVLSGYARAWSKQSPQAASEWALSLPAGSTRYSSLYSAVDQWIQKDSRSAAYWIFGQNRTEEIEEILSETAHQLSHVDPQAAFAFIESDPANEADPYRMRGHLIMALDNVMRKEPAMADPWIKRVEAQTLAAASSGLTHAAYEVPQSSYAEMINRWAAEDEQAAFAYLENATQLEEEERAAIERQTLERLQTDDPEKAAFYLLKRWQDSDQVAASSFAEALPQVHWDASVSSLKSHYQEIAEAWAKSEPQKVGFFVEQQEFLSPEETAKLLVAIQPF